MERRPVKARGPESQGARGPESQRARGPEGQRVRGQSGRGQNAPSCPRPLAPAPTQAGEEALARGVGREFASRRGETGVFRAANRYTVSLQGVRGA